jgi:hypothetical protein
MNNVILSQTELIKYREMAKTLAIRCKATPELEPIVRAARQLETACRRVLGEEVPVRRVRRGYSAKLDR